MCRVNERSLPEGGAQGRRRIQESDRVEALRSWEELERIISRALTVSPIATQPHPNPSTSTSFRGAIVERRCRGNILESGSTRSYPGRGGGSWGELPRASVLGWDPHWSEQLEWNVPGIKSLPPPPPLPLWSSSGTVMGGEKGDCSRDA